MSIPFHLKNMATKKGQGHISHISEGRLNTSKTLTTPWIPASHLEDELGHKEDLAKKNKTKQKASKSFQWHFITTIDKQF